MASQVKPIFNDVPEWPAHQAAAPAPAGHNKPPLEEIIPAEFREELLRDRPDFLELREKYLGAAERAVATNDDELGRCGNLVNGFRAILKHINDTHMVVKQPYLSGGRLVDAEKNALIADVEAAKKKVETTGNAYVADRDAKAQAERDRIAAEQRAAAEEAARAEREREAAERAAAKAIADAASDADREAAQLAAQEAADRAEQAMANASLAASSAPSAPEKVRSDEGATVSGKKEWKCEVTDYEVAFMSCSDDEKVREAIDKAIARRVKAGSRSIDGVRIWPVSVANYR